MFVSGDPVTGPDRPGPGTMGDALETGPERLLDHLRRPVPGRRNLLTEDAGNTVSETVPGCLVRGCGQPLRVVGYGVV